MNVSEVSARRAYLARSRDGIRQRMGTDLSPSEICEWFSDRLDDLLIAMLRHSLDQQGVSESASFIVVCVGGNGRRRPVPWSDVDLLIVVAAGAGEELSAALNSFVRDCWDTGMDLGHSIRTPVDVIRFASEDIQFATSLIDMRLLFGDPQIYRALKEKLDHRIFQERSEHFVARCVVSRREEWMARGDSVNQLEPDLKKSPGGLRDLHLLRWISYSRYGDADPSTLLQHEVIRTRELASLQIADEFLTGLRLGLHCRSEIKQDVLTRELQLEMVKEKDPHGVDVRAAVSAFMREYFKRTFPVAEISRRISESLRSAGLLTRLRTVLMPGAGLKGLPVHNGAINLTHAGLQTLRNNPSGVLEIFVYGAERCLSLSPDLRLAISRLVATFPAEPSRINCRQFRKILRSRAGLCEILRQMHETGVLEWLLPPFAEIRCLTQFNHYHSYTVDEHTLKTIDEVTALEEEDSQLGSAYRNVRHKATLHLSLLMHDIGKGREGDHSVIGESLCHEMGTRLQMAENKKQMMAFLVRQHLYMPDMALRRDYTDAALIGEFARMVGSPERLRMLYVLCAADIKAVGPGVWTEWKAELLADLYNRTMQIVSGRPSNHLERERIQSIRDHVHEAVVPVEAGLSVEWPAWVDQQLDALPVFYLMTEDPAQIARDLDVIQHVGDGEVRVNSLYDEESDTVTYRIFAAPCYEDGFFHKTAGILSGLRNNIHTAVSCGAADGTIVARFVVTDNDFEGKVLQSRMDEVATAVSEVLTGRRIVDSVFRRNSLFLPVNRDTVMMAIDPQVCIDNDCSDQYTVIDVFAMDTPGLLYTLSRTLYQHELSVRLARIATSIDQVVDVFHVTDREGNKVWDSGRLELIVTDLLDGIRALRESDESH
ncbi:MAG: [protein-PII] uridylyltransferase [Fuerstiella sp.]|nr:[protein-PII] uridylyltransferase [Fuerstiella sp.]